MANATSALRLSGMNSGLDTESIVNALTATTKNKINTNQRKVLKLQAQQEAYRSLITSFNNFKNKYFDILNGSTSLKSTGLFNSFKSTLTNAAGTNVNGVKVSSSVNANPGLYDVTVHKVATQATLKSAAASGKATDLSKFTDSSKKYSMNVSVNGKTKQVVFSGGSEADIRAEINSQLDVFGKKSDGSNIVTFGNDNKFVSSDKSGVISTQATLCQDSRTFGDINSLQTGNNTFTVTVGTTSKTVSFSTISADYFDDIFEADGSFKANADEEKVALYKEIALNQREKDVYNEFKDWNEGLTDAEKNTIAENVALIRYNAAINQADEKMKENARNSIANDMLKDVEEHITWKANDEWEADTANMSAEQATLYNSIHNDYNNKVASGEISADANDKTFISFKDYFRQEYKESIKASTTDADVDSYLANDEYGQKLVEIRDAEVKKIDDSAKAATEKVIEREQKKVYNEKFAEAKQEAYDAKVASGDISDTEGDENYVSLDKFKFTEEEFKGTSQYADYEAAAETIANNYDGIKTVDYENMSESEKLAVFKDLDLYSGMSEEDFIDAYTKEEAVKDFNTANIENNFGSLVFGDEAARIEAKVNSDGTITVEAKGRYTGNPMDFTITQSKTNASDFGIDVTDTSGTASQVDTTSKLSQLGLAADANGNYNFSINGHDFSFSEDTTVAEMMRKINGADAGVKMTYTTLTNQFTITSSEYGASADIQIQDGSEGLLTALGFANGQNFTAGQNTILTINGEDIETNSNEYTVDGTTFTFSKTAEGTSFTNEVTADYSKPVEAIKSFVEDYNKLIEEVYGYVDDEPNKDYYFLTDDDKEDMDLSESQETKWENLAKKGILYRDSTLTGIMSKLRTIIYNTVEAADGTKVGLYTLGITTSSNWTDHGKLVFDTNVSDEEFETRFAKYADAFCELFTDTEKGIAKQFEDVIDSATKTTGKAGERGVLVEKAGVSGTASATNNSIYKQIESLKSAITKLQDRYDQQQERYWKIYSNMETLLGSINSQSSYINQLMGM